MGQYYLVANMDKKEVLCVNGRFPGMKLLEIALNKEVALAILNRAAIQWKGDHIYLVGDYADLLNEDEAFFNALRMWTEKLNIADNLYDHVRDNFQKVEGDVSDKGYRFLYNHEKKEYLDLLHIPGLYEYGYETDSYIAPFPLLIAMGNERGGGDYFGQNKALVGSWCDSINSVEITRMPKDELGFEEFHPDFCYQ